MSRRREYINIDAVASISVRSNEVVIHTKDGKKIRCKGWRTTEIGGRAFIVAEDVKSDLLDIDPKAKSLLLYGAQLAIAALLARRRIRLPLVRI